jgi:hypothetical protein
MKHSTRFQCHQLGQIGCPLFKTFWHFGDHCIVLCANLHVQTDVVWFFLEPTVLVLMLKCVSEVLSGWVWTWLLQIFNPLISGSGTFFQMEGLTCVWVWFDEHILTHFSMLKIVWVQNFQQNFRNQGSIYVQSPTTNKIVYLIIKFGPVSTLTKFTLAKLKNRNAFSWFY